MGQFSSSLKAWNGLREANLTIEKHYFSPLKNQNYPPFFQNSSFASSFRLSFTGLFLPSLLGPKQLYFTWAKLDPKIVLYFTHRNGPIFGSETDLFDLQCIAWRNAKWKRRSRRTTLLRRYLPIVRLWGVPSRYGKGTVYPRRNYYSAPRKAAEGRVDCLDVNKK